MFLRRKIYPDTKPAKYQCQNSVTIENFCCPSFSSRKYQTTKAAWLRTDNQTCLNKEWLFINKIFFLLLRISLLSFKIIYSFIFFTPLEKSVRFCSAHTLYLSLFHYFFAVSQGSYLHFSVIQYWYNVLCHLERSFNLFMTFMHMINHSGWQFFPVQSSVLVHLCLVS